MASKHSGVQPVPVSDISELNHLGQTSSITLPKKRYWKLICAATALLIAFGGAGYWLGRSSLLNDTKAIAEAPFAESVPIAPNPDVISPVPLVLLPRAMDDKGVQDTKTESQPKLIKAKSTIRAKTKVSKNKKATAKKSVAKKSKKVSNKVASKR